VWLRQAGKQATQASGFCMDGCDTRMRMRAGGGKWPTGRRGLPTERRRFSFYGPRWGQNCAPDTSMQNVGVPTTLPWRRRLRSVVETRLGVPTQLLSDTCLRVEGEWRACSR
jgi:hypothetical protein